MLETGPVATHERCLLCNSKDIKLLKGYEKPQLVKCSNCKFVFMKRVPSNETLEWFYDSYGSKPYLSPLTVDSYNKVLDQLEKHRKHNTILDVGCGNGWFLDQAAKRGWKAYGTEYNEETVKALSKKGITMKHGVLNPADFGELQFDVILSSEVIEHINNPVPELANMYKLLRLGGMLYMTTPNFNCYLRYYLKDNYTIINYPEHLSFYTKRTLDYALRQTGFKRKKMLSTGISVTRLMKLKETTGVFIENNSSDEKIRETMSKNPAMKFIKDVANNLLTLTGTGLTLKAFYEK